MILMDSDNQLAMNLGETYLVTRVETRTWQTKTRLGYTLVKTIFFSRNFMTLWITNVINK